MYVFHVVNMNSMHTIYHHTLQYISLSLYLSLSLSLSLSLYRHTLRYISVYTLSSYYTLFTTACSTHTHTRTHTHAHDVFILQAFRVSGLGFVVWGCRSRAQGLRCSTLAYVTSSYILCHIIIHTMSHHHTYYLGLTVQYFGGWCQVGQRVQELGCGVQGAVGVQKSGCTDQAIQFSFVSGADLITGNGIPTPLCRKFANEFRLSASSGFRLSSLVLCLGLTSSQGMTKPQCRKFEDKGPPSSTAHFTLFN